MRLSKWSLPQQWVLPIAFVVLLLLILILEYPILNITGGVFIYPYDDSYIRMAIGKNLAFHQFWGLSNHEYAPASSSILYPMILAGIYKLTGLYLIIPFLINLLCALLFVTALQRWLVRQQLSPISQLLILLVIIFVTPLPTMVATGMEHSLQIFLAFLFIIGVCEWTVGEPTQGKSRRFPWYLYLYGFLSVAVRYEGLFLVIIAAVLILMQKKPLTAFFLALISALPVTLYGIYSLGQGGYFIPNSILIKGLPIPLNDKSITWFIQNSIIDRLMYPYSTRGAIAGTRLLIIIPLTYCAFSRVIRQNRLYKNILIFCLSVTILHLVFASANAYYRYEAYLMACSFLIPCVLIAKYGRTLLFKPGVTTWLISAWMGIILLYPFFSRSWWSYQEIGEGCISIFERDWQAASFLRKYYNTEQVIVDDLGANSYLSEGKKLDLISGAANMEVMASKEGDYFRREFIDYLDSRGGVSIALIIEGKYPYWNLRNWIKVATWQTGHVIPLGSPELSFYALNKEAATALRKNLEVYQSSLPRGVQVDYF